MKRYFLNIITFTTLLFSGAHAMADQNTHPNLTLLSNFAGEVFVNKDLSNLDAYMKKITSSITLPSPKAAKVLKPFC